MWTDEQINDAVQVLWNASQYGAVAKVTDQVKDKTEMYVVANNVTYTDGLYLKALEQLLKEKKLELAGDQNDRQMFRRVEQGGEAQASQS